MEMIYTGNDLGAVYSKYNTKFRVWAPFALYVKVILYDNAFDFYGIEIEMKKDIEGTWVVEIFGDIKNRYYTYKINNNGIEKETVDIYAKCLAVNGIKGIVIDLKDTNPDGWENDKRPILNNKVDSIIYELHIRDFTINKLSGVKNKGKYLGLSQKNTTVAYGLKTGIDHLVELGITHVQLMPILDFSSINETLDNEYNWGYDPYSFFAIEGSYCTEPLDGILRIKEFKNMIKAFHENNIRVVLDVVYNHTYKVEDSLFNKTVPEYYYRKSENGDYSNGSGCGNEIATEKPMVKKLIKDSIKYLIDEYHIDGFRFDLMALIDIDTMKDIQREVNEIDKSILLYGEPWRGGFSILDNSKSIFKGIQKNLNIAVFNDELRNAIKGSNDGSDGGYISNEGIYKDEILKGIVGEIEYNNIIKGFTKHPYEVINYSSCHDNLNLLDKIYKSTYYESEDNLIKMQILANTIIMTAQGIPFIHEGDEILRTKYGNGNSYNAKDEINNIEWIRKEKYYNVFLYYKNLIRLRKEHPAFRLCTDDEIRKHIVLNDAPDNVIMFSIINNANGDSWRKIIVIYNPHSTNKTINLPENGEWTVVLDSSIVEVSNDNIGLYKIYGKVFEINSKSSIILYKV